MVTANRICKICLSSKPITSFTTFVSRKGKKGHRHSCTACRKQQGRKATASSPTSYLRSWCKRGAGKGAHREVNITLEDLLQKWGDQQGRCAVTNMAMTFSPKSLKLGTGLNVSVDRINPEQNYTPKNVRLVCHRVNVMRSSGDDSDLVWWCQQIMQGKGHE